MNQVVRLEAFAPLGEDEMENAGAEVRLPAEPDPTLPVPTTAPPPTFQHAKHGTPSATWAYHDVAGQLLGHVARFDAQGGKEVLPHTWVRMSDGREGWRWKGFAVPRPLFGLDQLAARPGCPVLIVEGEKAASAAAERFPSHICMTWPGGTGAAEKVDWTPLRGRSVTIWPDADAPGKKAATAVAKLLCSAGARSVAVVELPLGVPKGWDLADGVPPGLNLDQLLAAAKPARAAAEMPQGYTMSRSGLVWRDPSDEDKPEITIAGRFDVLAETRDSEGTSWGVLLRWDDRDGREHLLPLARATLAGDGADARKMLLDGGLYVAPSRSARERLNSFLLSVRSSGRITATGRIGWHGDVFVLPDRSIGARGGEELLLQGSGFQEHAFRQRGSLQDWQHEVARFAAGNSRLQLALSAAFAAPLLGVCGIEGGGLHLRGASSTGKTTALAAAGSVWGGGEPGGYIRSWRATSNDLEGVALGHCDVLLCLDEISQVHAREAGQIAYMLANGAGKSRGTKDGLARRTTKWRTLFLSSGEIGLSDKLAEEGRGVRSAAGHQVRVVDLAADAGAGFGLFEDIHGFPSPDALARRLRTAATHSYGTAGPAFLDRIVEDLESVRAAVAQHRDEFQSAHVPQGADGQVMRVAQRFALIATGGELAVAAGVLPWAKGQATTAAAQCFQAWLDARGGLEPAEVREGIEQVRAFLHAHGASRFIPAWTEDKSSALPPRDVAGYRKRNDEGWDFYVTPPAWKAVCAGFDPGLIARVLAERDLLALPNSGRHRTKPVTVPGHGKMRLYHVRAAVLQDHEGHRDTAESEDA